MYYNKGKDQLIPAVTETNTDSHKILLFQTDKNIPYFEVSVKNKEAETISLNKLEIAPYNTDGISSSVSLPKQIEEIFVLDKSISFEIFKYAILNNIKVSDITNIPTIFQNIIKSKKDALTIINKDTAREYLNKNKYLYKIENQYYVSNKIFDGLKPQNDELKPELLKYSYKFSNNTRSKKSYDKNYVRHIKKDGRSYGPGITLPAGTYSVDIEGSNLNSADYSLYCNNGNNNLVKAYEDNSDNHKKLIFYTDETVKLFEVNIENKGSKEVLLSKLEIAPYNTGDMTSSVSLPQQIKHIFVLDKSMSFEVLKYAILNNIKVSDITNIPEIFQNFFTGKKDSLILVDKSTAREHLIENKFLYKIDNQYYYSDEEINGLPSQNEELKYELLKYNYQFKNNKQSKKSYDKNYVRHIKKDGRSYGPGITLPAGTYSVEIEGEKLDSAEYTLYYNDSKNNLVKVYTETNSDNNKTILFHTDKTIDRFEVSIRNLDPEEIALTKLEINYHPISDKASSVSLPEQIKEIFVLGKSMSYEMLKYTVANNIRVSEITKTPAILRNIFTGRKDSITLIDKDTAREYLIKNKYLYKIGNQYYSSDKIINGLQPQNEELKDEILKYNYEFKHINIIIHLNVNSQRIR